MAKVLDCRESAEFRGGVVADVLEELGKREIKRCVRRRISCDQFLDGLQQVVGCSAQGRGPSGVIRVRREVLALAHSEGVALVDEVRPVFPVIQAFVEVDPMQVRVDARGLRPTDESARERQVARTHLVEARNEQCDGGRADERELAQVYLHDPGRPCPIEVEQGLQIADQPVDRMEVVAPGKGDCDDGRIDQAQRSLARAS